MTNYRYHISAHNDRIATTTGQRPRFFVRNYGCQMNSRDSEKLSALLLELGYSAAEGQEDANFILYNTCCVRESAEDKIWGNLGRLKHRKLGEPDLMIAVTGCMAQRQEVAAEMEKKHPHINLVFGTSNRHRLPEFLWKVIETSKQIVDITETEELPEITDVSVTTREYPHKAGVNIMYGCNNFCAYCIVPHVRGREKSRPMADILAEVSALAQDGVKEIMLLGQNVNSYTHGGTLAFPELLEAVHNIPGVERIRFMTSHPKDLSQALIDTIARLPKVCKSIHLPIQSGSTKVLADMNRKYTKEEYLTLIHRLREAVPGIALSTDIIVGYPGETESDFEETLDVVQKVRFATAFTFLYSKRSGTPAAERTDTVAKNIASDRFQRLNATLNPILVEMNNAKIGRTFPVMVEEVASPTDYKGRTEDHSLIHFTSETPLHPGDIAPVTITYAKTFYLGGTHA